MRQTAAEIIDKAAVAGICIVIGHSEGTRCLVVSPGDRLRLALFEPDIPQNTGALLRLAACFGVEVDLIEPCGFLLDDRRLKRAALDYTVSLVVRRHASWTAFLADRSPQSRLILMTTLGSIALHCFAFAGNDTILLGRESAGVPEGVHRTACARVVI